MSHPVLLVHKEELVRIRDEAAHLKTRFGEISAGLNKLAVALKSAPLVEISTELRLLVVDVNTILSQVEELLKSDPDLTPTPSDLQEHVNEAFRMTDPRETRSGKTKAGGFRVKPKKP